MTRAPGRQSNSARLAIASAAVLLALLSTVLAGWQVHRRAWKHALIAAVDTRSHAAPVAAPGPTTWPRVTAERDAYRRVTISGRFRHDRETLVQALTDNGAGYWVLTPLQARDFTVLINRGFVPPEKREAASRLAGNPPGEVSITGLLRITEPGGGFLRANAPAANRWYSRDVGGIAAARRLGQTAPYFIDADATPNAGGYPIGGLTVVRFNDNHLVYALTWGALALLCGWGAWKVART